MGWLDKIFAFENDRKNGHEVNGHEVKQADGGIDLKAIAMALKAITINGRRGTITNMADNPGSYLTKGYSYNDIIYSIINLITDKIKAVNWGVYRESRNGLKPFEDERLQAVLDQPNPYTTFNELVAHHMAYKLLTGNAYLMAQRIEGGANEGVPAELWHLPADLVSMEITKGFPPRIVNYTIPAWRLTVGPESIIHSKEWNPRYDITGSQLYGQSPIKAAVNLLNRNNAAMLTSVQKYQNGGLEKIIFVDDDRFSGAETLTQAAALKAKILEYESNGARVAASGYKVGSIDLGLSPVELAIIESEKWDLRRMCNIYGVPPQLLGDTEGSTYNNMKEAAKAMLTRVVIPLLNEFKNEFNKKLSGDWGGRVGIIIDYDQTAFSELEEDKNEQMKWLLPLMQHGLPLNRVLEILGLEKINDPYYDEPRVTAAMGETLGERGENEVDILLNEVNGVRRDQ